MQQLLRINSIQAKIKIESSKAMLQMRSGRAQLNITRTVNGFNIKSQAAKVLISNRGLRESIESMKPPLIFMKECAENGAQAAQQAIADIVEEGNAMAETGTSIADIVSSGFIQNIETAIAFIPQRGPEISVSPQVLEINFTPDKIDFDWEITKPEGNYTPYELAISLSSYPKVNIEYVEKAVT